MDDIQSKDPSRGWLLLEAMERTDPDLWKVWADAKVAFDTASTPIPAGPHAFLHKSASELQSLKAQAQQAFLKVRAALWSRLEGEQLAGFGSRNSPVETPTLIYSSGWSHLVGANWDKSVLKEHSQTGAKIYNIRIFPLIHSPDAASRLFGCSLAQAFQRFVLEDPEVAFLGKRIVLQERRHQEVFREGQFPGRMVDFAWPLDLTSKDLAYNFVRAPFLIAGEPLPQAPASIQQVASIMVDRFLALKRNLVDGRVIARGTFVRTGIVGTIDPLQWSRHGASIDVRNSDLLLQENYKPVPLWTGITLLDPAQFQLAQRSADAAKMFHVEPTTYDPPPSPTLGRLVAAGLPNTPKNASIAKAIEALWPAGIPDGLSVKDRDQRIIAWQRKNDLTVASTKSIGRFIKRQKALV